MADQAGAPETFSGNWCNLEWSAWIPFNTASRTLDVIPDNGGLYRIRPTGQPFLMYIGWTAESLRQCFTGIRQNTAKGAMPLSDPWPVAPALWAWKDAKGYAYEFSAVPYGGGTHEEQDAAACYLAYRYRQEHHESPLCSFGRFHRKYRGPEEGVDGARGGKLGPQEHLNPAGGPSASPLPVTGQPGEPGWMGLAWSPLRNLMTHTTGFVPANQGYYLIFDAATTETLASGQSENCAQALFAISRNPWDGRELSYSFYCEPKILPPHNFRERACDLIGNYIELFGSAPLYQDWNHRDKS
jgi:hypothetical protein